MRRLAVLVLILACSFSATAQTTRPRPQTPPAASTPAPPPEPAAPVYEPQLLRLAEIIGALTYMSELCRPDGPQSSTQASGEAWRQKMKDLMEAEATHPSQKERLAGAYNKGFGGYQTTYRYCTPSGKLALERLLGEGAKLAQDLSNRFGS